jgi:hypothetical protein
MVSLGGMAGIDKEAVDPKTKHMRGLKGKTCTAGVQRLA